MQGVSSVWQPVKEESAAANAEPGLERCISLLKLVLKRGILNDSEGEDETEEVFSIRNDPVVNH